MNKTEMRKFLYRMDTMQILATRAIDLNERQQCINFTETDETARSHDNTPCAHPENHWVIESNATICGDCGVVLSAAEVTRQMQPVGEEARHMEPEGEEVNPEVCPDCGGSGEKSEGEKLVYCECPAGDDLLEKERLEALGDDRFQWGCG